MKYFAKYLPVEGGFKRVVKNDQGIPIDYHQEVQLFLCSRDILVGDKVLIDREGYPEIIVPSNMDQKGCEVMAEQKAWIKVIGPISPQAVWVKEGDEIEEWDWGHSSDFAYVTIKCPTCKYFH